MQVGYENIAIFDQYFAFFLEMVQDRRTIVRPTMERHY